MLQGTALDEWVRNFGLRMGHDIKLSVRVWLQYYRHGELKRPRPRTGPPFSVLVVVPDGGVGYWVREWGKRGALCEKNGVPGFPLPGLSGNAINWPLVQRTLETWCRSGGVLVAGFGRLCHVLAGCEDDAVSPRRGNLVREFSSTARVTAGEIACSG